MLPKLRRCPHHADCPSFQFVAQIAASVLSGQLGRELTDVFRSLCRQASAQNVSSQASDHKARALHPWRVDQAGDCIIPSA